MERAMQMVRKRFWRTLSLVRASNLRSYTISVNVN